MGIKAISFSFGDQELTGALLFGLIVLCINIELYAVKTLIARLTEEQGELFLHLHEHPLVVSNKAGASSLLS